MKFICYFRVMKRRKAKAEHVTQYVVTCTNRYNTVQQVQRHTAETLGNMGVIFRVDLEKQETAKLGHITVLRLLLISRKSQDNP